MDSEENEISLPVCCPSDMRAVEEWLAVVEHFRGFRPFRMPLAVDVCDCNGGEMTVVVRMQNMPKEEICLDYMLRKKIILTDEHVRYIGTQLFCAIQMMHACRVAHGNISPRSCSVTTDCTLTLGVPTVPLRAFSDAEAKNDIKAIGKLLLMCVLFDGCCGLPDNIPGIVWTRLSSPYAEMQVPHDFVLLLRGMTEIRPDDRPDLDACKLHRFFRNSETACPNPGRLPPRSPDNGETLARVSERLRTGCAVLSPRVAVIKREEGPSGPFVSYVAVSRASRQRFCRVLVAGKRAALDLARRMDAATFFRGFSFVSQVHRGEFDDDKEQTVLVMDSEPLETGRRLLSSLLHVKSVVEQLLVGLGHLHRSGLCFGQRADGNVSPFVLDKDRRGRLDVCGVGVRPLTPAGASADLEALADAVEHLLLPEWTTPEGQSVENDEHLRSFLRRLRTDDDEGGLPPPPLHLHAFLHPFDGRKTLAPKEPFTASVLLGESAAARLGVHRLKIVLRAQNTINSLMEANRIWIRKPVLETSSSSSSVVVDRTTVFEAVDFEQQAASVVVRLASGPDQTKCLLRDVELLLHYKATKCVLPVVEIAESVSQNDAVVVMGKDCVCLQSLVESGAAVSEATAQRWGVKLLHVYDTLMDTPVLHKNTSALDVFVSRDNENDDLFVSVNSSSTDHSDASATLEGLCAILNTMVNLVTVVSN